MIDNPVLMVMLIQDFSFERTGVIIVIEMYERYLQMKYVLIYFLVINIAMLYICVVDTHIPHKCKTKIVK